MALIALVSAKSDGVTTSAAALALASRRPVLLAELDMSGGSLRHGLLRDIPRGGQRLTGHVGLHRLPEAYWQRPSVPGQEADFTPEVAPHLWPLDDTDYRYVLPGLTDPRQAASLSAAWPTLLNVLQLTDQELGWDVIVDAGRLVLDRGRLHPVLTPAPVLHEADILLLVVNLADETSLSLAEPMAKALHDELMEKGHGARSLGLVTIGSGTRGEFRADDIARELDMPALAQLRWDERCAAYVRRGGAAPRGLARSALMSSARDAVGPLREFADRRRLHLQLRATQAASPHVMQQVRQLAQLRRAQQVAHD